MKRIVTAVVCTAMLFSGCSSHNTENINITAAEILSLSDVTPYLEYTPEMAEKNTRRYSIAEYRSTPAGTGDPVIVKIYQKNQLISQEAVKEYFDECRNTRSSAFSIESLSAEAFIAYPSIHCYTHDCHIEITAGSGADNQQKILLMNLAKLALENLNELKGVSKNSDM